MTKDEIIRKFYAAEDDFQANLVRQFGKKATDYRYNVALRAHYDAQTWESFVARTEINTLYLSTFCGR